MSAETGPGTDSPTTAASKCSAEAAGYDGRFGVYCDLPNGHDGLHNDGFVEWRFVDDPT